MPEELVSLLGVESDDAMVGDLMQHDKRPITFEYKVEAVVFFLVFLHSRLSLDYAGPVRPPAGTVMPPYVPCIFHYYITLQ